MSPVVKWLIILNVAVFVLHYAVIPLLLQPFGVPMRESSGWIIQTFGFRPSLAVGTGWVWQFFTYLFLHGSFMHIALNMLFLWMFGGELERVWGPRAFLRYYFVTGVGAACFQIPVSWDVPSVGASGAVYGLLVGYAVLFPHRRVYLYLLFPVPARVFVTFAIILELWLGLTATGSGIAHLAHVGGGLVGFLYLKRAWRVREWAANLRWRWKRRRYKVLERREEDEWDPWDGDDRIH